MTDVVSERREDRRGLFQPDRRGIGAPPAQPVGRAGRREPRRALCGGGVVRVGEREVEERGGLVRRAEPHRALARERRMEHHRVPSPGMRRVMRDAAMIERRRCRLQRIDDAAVQQLAAGHRQRRLDGEADQLVTERECAAVVEQDARIQTLLDRGRRRLGDSMEQIRRDPSADHRRGFKGVTGGR